ncbi:MAG: hypothetical protein KF845_02825 [Cyclobacteriaceae bacterium]|nr:hypothetical protein [Cyclobacteriaceae bacterium]
MFDRVFERLEQKPLLENPNFQIDYELKADHFFRFNSVEKDGRIRMMFEIAIDRLTFWLDRTNEIPEWSIEFIKEKKDEVERELKLLYESEVLVEYKGNRTRIILLDKSGVKLRRFSYYEGLSINWFSSTTRKKYKPYFEI